MAIDTDQKKIDTILDRGVIVNILPTKEDFRKLLLSGKQLRFYIGIDATATAIHLSHAKNFMLLEEFRKLGHKVFVLVGDFTARIGDPSDEKSARKQLSSSQVRENVAAMSRQIKPLLNFKTFWNPAKLVFNSTWLSKLGFEEIANIASNFTVQHFLERDMFQKRMTAGNPVHLHEFLYPLMQGYDSVALDVDAEIGGTDQTFNMLAGRTLQKRINNREKFVIAVHLLENPKTGELMSKSKGNGVFANSSAEEMFGQVMAQPDEMIQSIFTNLTRIPFSEIDRMMKEKNPKDLKLRLGLEIVKLFHGEERAQHAQEVWTKTFSKKEIPDEMEEVSAQTGELFSEILLRAHIIASKSDFRRLVSEHAVTDLDTNEKITDEKYAITKSVRLRIGKRRFVKISIQ